MNDAIFNAISTADNIEIHKEKKFRSSIIVCFSHSSLYVPNNLYLILIEAF